MSDDPQYQPIRWHYPPEFPIWKRNVTWVAVGSPQQIDGRYDGNGIWYRDDGKRAVTGENQIVQWRYRR
jgi:hypothetical protein